MIEENVIKRIKELADHRHWTLYRLAKEAELSYSTLNNLFNRGTCPTIPVLEHIVNGFGITLSEFFDGVDDVDAPREKISGNTTLISCAPEEEDLVYIYRSLSKSDKALLAAYLKGLGKKL